MIEIYTDGSCLQNGKADSHGGYGVVVVNDGKIIHAYSHFEDNTTNNKQEIKAILYALINFGKYNPVVYSDSSYCVNTFTNWMFGWANRGWLKSDNSPPENLELIKAYYNLIQENNRIDLRKIKGHSGHMYNELADKLATGKLTPDEVMKGEF